MNDLFCILLKDNLNGEKDICTFGNLTQLGSLEDAKKAIADLRESYKNCEYNIYKLVLVQE